MVLTKKFFVVVVFVFLLSGCKDTLTNNGNKNQIVFPDSNVSYRKHVQPLFNLGCALSDCHDKQYPDRNFDLRSYSGFMYSPGIVYDSVPENSKLIQRVEGTVLPQMPPYQKPLNKNQQQGLRKWVAEGAQNN